MQPDNGYSFQQWLDRQGQTRNAVAHFWHPILISALSEELDHISVSAAAQVVRESMKTPAARHMGVPTLPLTDLYSAAGDYVGSRGGTLHFRCPIEGFTAEASQVRVRVRGKAAMPEESFAFLVLAVPFDALDSLLPQTAESVSIREQVSHFQNSPITGIHLWFDRPISDLDHAVLLDRTIQWMFHKSRLQPMRARSENGSGAGSYIELVVSSSKTLIEKSRAEIVELALGEVREFFSLARDANLVKSTVIKEVNATYSPRPGIDAHRPTPITGWPRVFLAGDWTATGWPATMEGAVRSGYLAAEALADAAGLKNRRFLSPDMPASGIMRLFVK